MNYKAAIVGSSSANSDMSSGAMTPEGGSQHKTWDTLRNTTQRIPENETRSIPAAFSINDHSLQITVHKLNEKNYL